jgi:hypothetical protein
MAEQDKTLTLKQKAERWDLVDNAIQNLIITLNPTDYHINYVDMPIHDIRMILYNLYVKDLKLCTEYEFYP